MPSFSDLSEVAQGLSRRDLPFNWYAFVPDDDSLGVEVAPVDVEAAEEYFAKHSVTLLGISSRHGERMRVVDREGVRARGIADCRLQPQTLESALRRRPTR